MRSLYKPAYISSVQSRHLRVRLTMLAEEINNRLWPSLQSFHKSYLVVVVVVVVAVVVVVVMFSFLSWRLSADIT